MISANWSQELIKLVIMTPNSIFCRMKWQPTSICLVFSWNIGLEAICSVAWLLHIRVMCSLFKLELLEKLLQPWVHRWLMPWRCILLQYLILIQLFAYDFSKIPSFLQSACNTQMWIAYHSVSHPSQHLSNQPLCMSLIFINEAFAWSTLDVFQDPHNCIPMDWLTTLIANAMFGRMIVR